MSALAVPAQSGSLIPPRSIAPPKSQIDDEFVGYLFALVHRNLPVDASGEKLLEIFPEYADDAETPMDFIARFERSNRPDDRWVRLTFTRAFTYPAPIDILGHRPVMMSSSNVLTFAESVEIDTSTEGVSSAYVLRRTHGWFEVDFAGWLDFLLGSLVDDVSVEVVLAAWFDDRWYGAMAGFNPDGEIVTSVYDMRRGRFLASPPREISEFAVSAMD